MSEPWPFPRHTTVADRDRFACQVFREALQRADPRVAGAVDAFLQRFDHPLGWLFAPPEPDAEVWTRAEFAAQAGVKPDTVSMWALRFPELLPRVPGGHLKQDAERFLRTERKPGRRRTAATADQLDL